VSGSLDTFIARWTGVTASELATAQSFVIDLCRLLDVEAPHPTPEQDYMFERPITFRHGDGGASAGRIDCYRRGCFVLEAKKIKVGAGRTAKEQAIYDKGLVAVLKSLHDDLDAAVLDAYGWNDSPTDAQLLERLVALNAARASEEAHGNIRWLRPAFQNPHGALALSPQTEAELATRFTGKAKWKSRLPELLATLATLGRARQLEDGQWLG
jgi:hypothetical protein